MASVNSDPSEFDAKGPHAPLVFLAAFLQNPGNLHVRAKMPVRKMRPVSNQCFRINNDQVLGAGAEAIAACGLA